MRVSLRQPNAPFRGLRLVSAIAAAVAGLATAARAQVSDLGLATNYSCLELGSGSQDAFQVSQGSTSISGNVGVAGGGTFNYSGGGTISGELVAGSNATLSITGGDNIQSGTVAPYSQMSQVVSDAQSAASTYQGLSADHTYGSITGSTTLNGNGGLEVIDINGGINLGSGQSLTISGNASDSFVINVTGGIDLSQADITLCGVSADQVVFNLIGTGDADHSGNVMQTTGGSDTSGIFLAENGAIDIQGGTHASEFIAGGALDVGSGACIDQAIGQCLVAPELNASLMAAIAAGLLVAVEGGSRLKAARNRKPTV